MNSHYTPEEKMALKTRLFSIFNSESTDILDLLPPNPTVTLESKADPSWVYIAIIIFLSVIIFSIVLYLKFSKCHHVSRMKSILMAHISPHWSYQTNDY